MVLEAVVQAAPLWRGALTNKPPRSWRPPRPDGLDHLSWSSSSLSCGPGTDRGGCRSPVRNQRTRSCHPRSSRVFPPYKGQCRLEQQPGLGGS